MQGCVGVQVPMGVRWGLEGTDRQTDGQGGIYLSPREGPLPAALKWVRETARLPPSPE